MNTKPELVKELEGKYIKTYEISDLKDMLLKATDKFSNKPAFTSSDNFAPKLTIDFVIVILLNGLIFIFFSFIIC